MRLLRNILTLMLMGISIAGVAQPRLRTPEIYIGAHAGAMASSMYFSPSVEHINLLQSPISINGGLVFRYAGHKVCAIQAELNYMQRGWRECGNAGMDYVRQLDYIELPLLMHLYFGKQRFRAFLNLGPQIGYCIRDLSKGTPLYPERVQYQAIDNRFDWGLAGGIGCYYRTKKIGLFQLEARANFSMGTAFSNRKVDYFSQSNAMNLSLNFAYMWEIRL